MIWDKALEAVLLAAALLWPLSLFANGYDPALVKTLAVQACAALAAACWAGRSIESGRFEVPRGRGPWAAAGLAWLAWQPSAAPILYLAALLGPASSGFLRRLQGAGAVTAAAVALLPALMPDTHERGALFAMALALLGAWRQRPGEPAAPLWLGRGAALLCLYGIVQSGSPAGVIGLAGAALFGRSLPLAAALPAVFWLTPVADAQWLLLEPALRPAALLALPVALRGTAPAGALVGLAAFTPTLGGPLGALTLGAGAALFSSGVVVRVAPIPLPLLARRCAYLPAAALLVWALAKPATLFVSDARYNEAVALADAQPDRALELLAGVSPQSPLHPRAALTEAALHLRAGRVEAALLAYRRSGDPRAHRAVGILEAGLGRWDLALAALKQAAPDDVRAWKLRLEAAQHLRDRAEALEAARGLVRAQPREPASWYALAEAAQDSKLYAESRRARSVGARAARLARLRRAR